MIDRPELNTFLVQPPNKDRSQIIIFLGPVLHGGINKERIFILAEITSPNLDFKNQIQGFINQLAKKYQELEKENSLIAFENSLEWANRELRENLEPKELSQISIIFGSLRNEQLQFAAGGQINAHIFYKEKEAYKNNDLIKTYSTEENDSNIFFPNLISGVIHQNNFTLFSTPTVLNYLTLDRLQKIITGNKTDEICQRVETLLNEMETKAAFGGILIAWPELKQASSPISTFKLTPNESINRLLKKQKETAQIMSPAILQSIKKYLQNRKNKKISSTQEDIQILKKITKIYTRLTGWQGKISAWGQKILLILGQKLFTLFLLFKRLLQKVWQINWQTPHKLFAGLKNAPAKVWLKIKNQLLKFKERFASLNLKKRLLFSATFLICLILVINIFSIYLKQKINKGSVTYNQTVGLIESKIAEAESNLIYKNDARAEELIKEVKDSLATLPVNNTERQNTKNRLAASLQPLIYKLQKFQPTSAILEIELPKAVATPSTFVKTGSYFVFLSPNSPDLALFNKATKQFTKINNEKINSWKDISAQKDGTVLIVADNNYLTKFDPANESFTTQETVLPAKESGISLAVTYNAKLYSLDIKNNLIYKHLPSTTGFGKGEPWLSPSTKLNFSDAVSLAVDGDIYVAKKNGQIYKLTAGNLADLNISYLDPILISLKKIYTKNGSDSLFVLDPEKQRVIIWSKSSNKLVSQLTAPEIKNSGDFSVDEKEKKVYLLNGSKVFSLKY